MVFIVWTDTRPSPWKEGTVVVPIEPTYFAEPAGVSVRMTVSGATSESEATDAVVVGAPMFASRTVMLIVPPWQAYVARSSLIDPANGCGVTPEQVDSALSQAVLLP